MRFDKLIKRTYKIIAEQDENPSVEGAPDAAMPNSTNQEIDKISSQVENMSSEVLELVGNLTDLLSKEENAGRIKLTPEISRLLDELKSYTASSNPSQGLDGINKAVKDAESDYIPTPR
jgi:hypothetical protein